MRKVCLLLVLFFLFSSCSTTPQRSNFLYPDPINMSSSAICYRLMTAVLASEYRQSLWEAEIKKRGVICTGGYSYYEIPNKTYASQIEEEFNYNVAVSQQASNERGETCIKYDSQYWECDTGYKLEWNNNNCLYECFAEDVNNRLIIESDTKIEKPGGPPSN